MPSVHPAHRAEFCRHSDDHSYRARLDTAILRPKRSAAQIGASDELATLYVEYRDQINDWPVAEKFARLF
jgi:hypothetical protein